MTDEQIKEIREAKDFNDYCSNRPCNECALEDISDPEICWKVFSIMGAQKEKSKCEECVNEQSKTYCSDCVHYPITKKDKFEPKKKLVKKELDVYVDFISCKSGGIVEISAKSDKYDYKCLGKCKLIYEVEED